MIPVCVLIIYFLIHFTLLCDNSTQKRKYFCLLWPSYVIFLFCIAIPDEIAVSSIIWMEMNKNIIEKQKCVYDCMYRLHNGWQPKGH